MQRLAPESNLRIISFAPPERDSGKLEELVVEDWVVYKAASLVTILLLLLLQSEISLRTKLSLHAVRTGSEEVLETKLSITTLCTISCLTGTFCPEGAYPQTL
jgi:hypothetical protein